jgi:DNA-binding NarL/FixJ family response regulator
MTPRILVAVYGDHQQAVVSELLDYAVRVPLDVMDAIAASHQRDRRFDLLVLDAEMPESYGAAEYAEHFGWAAKAIFVSTVDDLKLRLRASQIRCDAFLLLPNDLNQLKPLVTALMEDICS